MVVGRVILYGYYAMIDCSVDLDEVFVRSTTTVARDSQEGMKQ
jgi:hypothetical protein